MKTLYIHVGTSKTGSTALQTFCAENRKILETNGFYYPAFPIKYDYVGKARNGHFLYTEDMDDKESVFWDCIDTIRESFQTCSNVILSDEKIWRLSHKWHKKFFEVMQKEDYCIKLIIYLRRQDEYVASSWNQFVKKRYFVQKSQANINESFEDNDGTWETFLKTKEKNPLLDYYKLLKKLETVYGKKNLLVRRYDRQRFPKHSICADFMQVLGLELTEEYCDAQANQNPSLSPNAAEIQRILNTMPDQNSDDNFYFFNKILLSFSDLSRKNYSCSMFSKEEAKAFLEPYQKGNRKIAKEYFGEEELFSFDEEEETKWEKDNPYMQDDLIRFVGASCMRILEENKKMRQELRQLERVINKIKHPIRTMSEKLCAKQLWHKKNFI